MKKIALLIIFIGFYTTTTAQKSEGVVGTWLSATKEGHIQIYKKGDKYYGNLNWIITPNDAQGKPQTDIRNIHPELRSRKLLGLEILKDFTNDGDSYKNGNIYDPKRGRAFSCKLVLKGNTLVVKGYLGFVVAHTEQWTRIN